MNKNVRPTGCTRFFIAMLIIIPSAYFISMYVTGDSIDFKQLFNKWMGKEQVEKIPEKDADDSSDTKKWPRSTKAASGEVEALKEELSNMKAKMEKLELELEIKNKLIEELTKK